MPDLGEPISERELDVLNCLAEGASNREIADRLSISHHTVKVHVRNIFTKLGVSSRTEATTVALQKGVLAIPGIDAEPIQEEEVALEPMAMMPVAAPMANSVAHAEPVQPTAPSSNGGAQSRPANRRLLLMVGFVSLLALVLASLAARNLLGGDQTPPDSPPTEPSDAAPAAELFQETSIGDSWVASRAMPQARSRMTMATVGLSVYAIGGENAAGVDNTVLIYDTQQRQWREGAPKLTAVANAASDVLAGEIYVAGGYDDNGRATTAVEAYSPLNNAWRPVTALPRPTSGAVAIASDGLLYLFGGEDREEILADAYVYDPGTQQWQALPPMNEARTLAVGGALGGKLYVVGGSDGSQALASCELFDPLAAEWSDCPSLIHPRVAAGAAVFLNKIYVLGGVLSGASDSGEVYDAAEESWSEFNIPMLAEDADWPHLGVSSVESHIYALGGERMGQLSDEMYVYRPLVFEYFIPAASAGGGE